MCISVPKTNRCQNTKKSEPSVLEGLILLRDFHDDIVFPIVNRVSLLTSPFIADWRSIFGSWWKSLTSSFLRNIFDSWTFCCLASSLTLLFLSWYKMPALKNINAYNTANTNMHSFRRIFLLIGYSTDLKASIFFACSLQTSDNVLIALNITTFPAIEQTVITCSFRL